MKHEYKVVAFVPTVKGCGAKDNGWDIERCNQFQEFLNSNTADGWKLHSSEYRQITLKGCGNNSGSQLICIFEK